MKRSCLMFLLLCSLACGMSSPSWAEDRRLLIAVLDQVTWQDLLDEETQAPTLHGLAEKSGVGMMCVRTARGPGGGYLTVGAGSRASSGWISSVRAPAEGYAFQAREALHGVPAGQLYTSYTGWTVGDSAIVHLGIGELLQQNSSASYPLRLGLLGDALRAAGLRVACIGNADTPGAVHREAVGIAMDGQGLVPLGDVSADLVRPDPSLPYQQTTDRRRLLASLRSAASAAHVVVLELGETSRAAEYAELTTPEFSRLVQLRAIESADRLLAEALASLSPEEWAVLVISPNARALDPEERLSGLAPIMFYRPHSEPGLLTSPSTRRPGLVANTDVASTVLSYFGLPLPAEAIGRPITCQPAPDGALGRLRADSARHNDMEWLRRKVFQWLPSVAAVTLFIAALCLLLGTRVPRWVRSLLRALLLLLLAAPAAMLAASLRPLPVPQMLAVIAGTAIAIALLGSCVTGWRSGHVLPALLLVGFLAYDLSRGQHMLHWSPFSYSVAAGARFYGIGNEYAGALLGATLVMVSGLLSRRKLAPPGERPFAVVVLAAIVGLVGCPLFGANLGMALACAVGFAVFTLYLWQDRPTGRHLLAILLLALVVAAAAVAADLLLRGPEASHIGRWAMEVKSRGWHALAEVFQRKWAMNWLLTRASRWSSVALAALALFVVALAARPRGLVSVFQERPWLAPALGATVAGAAAAWLVNDSGMVAAALALLYGGGVLGYLGLHDECAA